jgi:hypothetical protein
MDGLTEISSYGMNDYFRDEFNNIDTNTSEGMILGGWDIHNKQYVISSQTNISNPVQDYKTLSFDESIKGWTSFFTYKPDHLFSLKNKLYTMKDGDLWEHYSTSVNRGSFYGVTSKASVTFVFNPNVSASKVFKTISYEGSNGWQVDSFVSDATGYDALSPNFFSDSTALVYSYDGGAYTESGFTMRAGFDRKENKYHANLINNTTARSGEIVFGDSMSGIKGFYATVKVSTDSTTNVGGLKELFAVSSNYVESSY